MLPRIHGLLVALFVAGASTACGPSVSQSSGGAGGAGGSASTSSGAGGCSGGPFDCAPGCGGDVFGQAECKAGSWQCEPGWVNVNECPSGSCFGLPLPCETCPDGWACEPSSDCIGSFGSCETVCLECPEGFPGTVVFNGCACACNSAGEYQCTPAAGCCNTDLDCGDKFFVPCVEHVCKTPVPGACWSDAECPPGQTCHGAAVCPCGAACDESDAPGMCAP